jgi:alcohol dehydrogenase
MDCAKGINFLLTNGGRMEDYKGTGKASRPMLPMIAVPTTAGTGSEAQSYAVIADAQSHMKMACGDKKALPRITLLDPQLTLTMPRAVTAMTGIDALSHALETFVTKRKTPISEMYSLQAWLHLQALPQVLKQPDHLDARAGMQLGAYFAGAAIEQSMLGATHALANPLSAHYDLPHGVAIGVLLPYVVRFNARDAQTRAAYGWLAQQAGLDDGDRQIESLKAHLIEIVRTAGQPTNLKACDVDAASLPVMAAEAAQQWTSQFNPRGVDESSLLEIYRWAYDELVAGS